MKKSLLCVLCTVLVTMNSFAMEQQEADQNTDEVPRIQLTKTQIIKVKLPGDIYMKDSKPEGEKPHKALLENLSDDDLVYLSKTGKLPEDIRLSNNNQQQVLMDTTHIPDTETERKGFEITSL